MRDCPSSISISSWNSNGLTDGKLQATALQLLSEYDITAVWETRNNPSAIDLLTKTHTIFKHDSSATTPGHGALILIKHDLTKHCQYLGFNPDIPLAWVRIYDTYIGLIYAPPRMLEDFHQRTDFLATLQLAVSQKSATGRVMLLGDFNARLGAFKDCSDIPRTIVDHRHNPFGRMLMDWCEEIGLMTLTGRKDNGQVTWKQGDTASRIDHAFVQPDMYPDVTANIPDNYYGSDHKPLCITLHNTLVQPSAPSSNLPLPPRLNWNYHNRSRYLQRVYTSSQIQDLLSRIPHCDNTTELDHLADTLHNTVWNAAVQAGMGPRQRPRTPTRPKTLTFPPEAMHVKREIRALYKAGLPVPLTLRKEWRRWVKTARKAAAKKKHEQLANWFTQHKRIFWSVYSNKRSVSHAILPTAEWRTFLSQKFQAPTDVPPSTPPTQSPPTDLNPHCPLTCPITVPELLAACAKVGTGKAIGTDGIPSEFWTHSGANLKDPSPLHLALLELFNTILRLGHIPPAWKSKTISPLYKKGDPHDPVNYRPLSVTTAIYRIFTAILATRLTSYTDERPGHLAPTQFAFQKKLSVHHVHMILQTCCDKALATKQPLVLLHLDIDKAYDTILHHLLWKQLADQGIPHKFISLMQEVYRHSTYQVKVNGELSAAFNPSIGVQQGCPLSPWAYNEYIAPALKKLLERCAALGITLHLTPCSHADFADDIIGIVRPDQVSTFLEVVAEILGPLNQHLNLGKVKAVVIQPQQYPHPTIAGVNVVHTMKILGLEYNHKGCMTDNMWLRRRSAHSKAVLHAARLKALGCHHDVKLTKVMTEADIRPTLLFGSVMWGYRNMTDTDPMDHPLQAPYSTLPRRALQLPTTTAHWIVSMLTGTLPIKHWIIRDFCRFWNGLLSLTDTNTLLAAALQEQHNLLNKDLRNKPDLLTSRHRPNYWLGKWYKVFCVVFPNANFHQRVRTLAPLPEQLLLDTMLSQYRQLLAGTGDPFAAVCPRRHIALTYTLLSPQLHMGKTPPPLHVKAPPAAKKTWIAFLGAALAVPVHDHQARRNGPNRTPWQHVTCCKCATGEVADEAHVLLRCPATHVARQQFPHLLSADITLSAFVTMYSGTLRFSRQSPAPFFVQKCMDHYNSAPSLIPDPSSPSTEHPPLVDAPSSHTDITATTVTTLAMPPTPQHSDSHVSMEPFPQEVRDDATSTPAPVMTSPPILQSTRVHPRAPDCTRPNPPSHTRQPRPGPSTRIDPPPQPTPRPPSLPTHVPLPHTTQSTPSRLGPKRTVPRDDPYDPWEDVPLWERAEFMQYSYVTRRVHHPNIHKRMRIIRDDDLP